jgi:hypothetical protein
MPQVFSRSGAALRRAVLRRAALRGAVLRKRVATALTTVRSAPEAGMSTAEYAIGTIAACAFAALLYKVITSSQILSLLTGLVSRALHVPF